MNTRLNPEKFSKSKPKDDKPKIEKRTRTSTPHSNHLYEQNDEEEEIIFTLLRHPNEKNLDELQRKYLKTSTKVTIHHLCKYLALKLGLPYTQFIISQNTRPIDGSATLESLREEYWNELENPASRVLYYRLEITETTIRT